MRCILHIGPPKTGSTSVQSFIKRNKKSFKDLGIFIPKTRNANMAEFHYANKTKITQGRAATAMGLSKANFETSQIAIRRKMNRQFRKAKAKGYKTLLVTSEGLAQSSAQEISLLKDWLSNFFAEFQIVIALRRQDLRALSTYKNQVMINGAKHKRYLGQSESMKYDTLLEKWANAFGQSSITPILFPDSILEKTDFLQSFCTAIGVEGVYNPQDASTYQKNQNMDGRAVELLRLLNAQQVKSGDASQSAGRRFLELTLSSLDLNEPLKNKPSRAQVETLYNLYKEGNETVRKTYFPDRNSLFQEDFSTYPNAPETAKPDVDFMVALIKALESDTYFSRRRNLLKERLERPDRNGLSRGLVNLYKKFMYR